MDPVPRHVVPFMVQTRDGFVCTTGICAFLHDVQSRPERRLVTLPHTKNSRGDTGVAVVSDHDKNGCKMQAATRKVSKKDTDRSFFHFERVCVETVQKLLKSPARNDISNRVRSRAHDMAIKTMLAYAKGQRERGAEFSLIDACLRGLYVFTVKAGKYTSPPPSDDFVNHVAKRVKDLCMHFSFDEKETDAPRVQDAHVSVPVETGRVPQRRDRSETRKTLPNSPGFVGFGPFRL